MHRGRCTAGQARAEHRELTIRGGAVKQDVHDAPADPLKLLVVRLRREVRKAHGRLDSAYVRRLDRP